MSTPDPLSQTTDPIRLPTLGYYAGMWLLAGGSIVYLHHNGMREIERPASWLRPTTVTTTASRPTPIRRKPRRG